MHEIIERIKKLLRMRRGGTPNEISTALRLAQELADKHGIDLAHVNPDDEARKVGHVWMNVSVRTAYEQDLAYAVIRGWFNVDAIFVNALTPDGRLCCRLYIAGDACSRQIGAYVYVFLVRAFRRAWRQRSNHRLRNRRSFLYGMYVGITKQLPKREAGAVPSGDALALCRNTYLSALFPHATSKPINHGAYMCNSAQEGYLVGLRTKIRQGMDGRSAPELAGNRQLLEA